MISCFCGECQYFTGDLKWKSQLMKSKQWAMCHVAVYFFSQTRILTAQSKRYFFLQFSLPRSILMPCVCYAVSFKISLFALIQRTDISTQIRNTLCSVWMPWGPQYKSFLQLVSFSVLLFQICLLESLIDQES